MIVVRNVFKLKFGKTREALAVFREGQAFAKKPGAGIAPPACSPMSSLLSTLWSSSKPSHPWPNSNPQSRL